MTVHVDEHPFMQHLLIAFGTKNWCRVWRQNVGKVLVRDDRGRPLRMFDAGPPSGVADISGFVRPQGWRLEIEVKCDDGRMRKEQLAFQRVALAGGVIYVVVEFDDSLDMWTNVEAAVKKVGTAVYEREVSERA